MHLTGFGQVHAVVRKYITDLEEFGLVTFEIRPRWIDARFRNWDGKGSLVQFVMSLNISRRQRVAGSGRGHQPNRTGRNNPRLQRAWRPLGGATYPRMTCPHHYFAPRSQ